MTVHRREQQLDPTLHEPQLDDWPLLAPPATRELSRAVGGEASLENEASARQAHERLQRCRDEIGDGREQVRVIRQRTDDGGVTGRGRGNAVRDQAAGGDEEPGARTFRESLLLESPNAARELDERLRDTALH